jgi:hypothetical protein
VVGFCDSVLGVMCVLHVLEHGRLTFLWQRATTVDVDWLLGRKEKSQEVVNLTA